MYLFCIMFYTKIDMKKYMEKIIGILNLQKKAQEGIIWNVCYCTRLDIMLTRHWFVIRQPDINQRIVLITMLLR